MRQSLIPRRKDNAVPVRLFASRRLDDFLSSEENDLDRIETSAVRDGHFPKKVTDAARQALVRPLVFDRSKAKFATKSVADGGVSVTLKLPYSGSRELFDCSTNGYVFERAGRIVAPSSYDLTEVDKTIRVEFHRRFDSTAQDPIRDWAREVGDDCDRQAAQQAPVVARHNERVKARVDRLIAEAEDRAGEAERLAVELGEGI